jgi:hypothetical protein
MSRTPARITQADAARIIRAAKQTGADSVRFLLPDCTIQVDLQAPNPTASAQKGVAPKMEIVL